MDFLKNTFYHTNYLVVIKGKIDLIIHTSKEVKTGGHADGSKSAHE